MKQIKKIVFLLCITFLLAGCSNKEETEEQQLQVEQEQKETEEQAKKEAEEKQKKEEEERAKKEAEEKALEEAAAKKRALVIVLDAGHSGTMESGSEPLGPGSSEYKEKDTGGTSGVSSGVAEYELNLVIAKQLRTELEERGYTVLMTRETSDVPRSNIERADVANNANAAAYIRIHANGSTNQSAQGAMAICITPNNPYISQNYTVCRQLSDCVLTEYCKTTGAISEGVWETDTMCGNNWSQVPTTLIEMGYMTNPEEDLLMQTAEYQQKIVLGIANGIDVFLGY